MQSRNFPLPQEHVKTLYSSRKWCVSDLSIAERNYLIKTIAINLDYGKLIELMKKCLTSENVMHAVMHSLIFGNDGEGTLLPFHKKIIELIELNIFENTKTTINNLFDNCAMNERFEKMVELHNTTLSHQQKNSNS